jgi:hypothetical protein
MSKPVDCRAWREALAAQVLGELDAAREAGLRRHLELCAACRAVRDALAAEERELRATFAVIARRGADERLNLCGSAPLDSRARQTIETSGRPIRRLIMRHKWTIPATAAAAILVVIAIWPGDHTVKHAYGMTDIPGLLRSAVVHVSGKMYVPLLPTPGLAERSPIDCEYWIDAPNSRTRQTRYSYSIRPDGTEVSIGEVISDGSYVMELNHTAKTAEFRRLDNFHRALNARETLDNLFARLFGGAELDEFVKVGQEQIGGVTYTIWEAVVEEPLAFTAYKVRCALAPATGAIGELECWMRPLVGKDAEWLEVIHLDNWERAAAVLPGTFDTTVPAGYTPLNTKETAELPPLSFGGGAANDIVYTQFISFHLPDGSIVLAWASEDQLSERPQDDLFAGLEFGGDLPKLPMEFAGLQQRLGDREIEYPGRHLAYTRTGQRFIEWSLYVPQQEPPKSRWRSYHGVVQRFNLDDDRVEPWIMANVSRLIWIEGAGDFDVLVRGAMAELADDHQAPAGITFERTMELARRLRTTPLATEIGSER